MLEKMIKMFGYEDRRSYDWITKYKSYYDELDYKTKVRFDIDILKYFYFYIIICAPEIRSNWKSDWKSLQEWGLRETT